MTERTVLERFTDAVEIALALPPPSTIALEISTSSREVDDGLRGTAYDGDRVTGGTSGSHPERMLARRHPGQFPKDDDIDKPGRWSGRIGSGIDDLSRLAAASARAIEAIATLNRECCDATAPALWQDATKDAHLLLEAGYLEAAMDVGRHVENPALRFSYAVDTVRAIRDSYMAHEAPDDVAEANYPWCQSHARIGEKVDRLTRKLCRWCWDQLADLEELDERVALQEEERRWPSVEMLRAHADGRMVDVKRERNAWLKAQGLDPNRIHQRRQSRRSA